MDTFTEVFIFTQAQPSRYAQSIFFLSLSVVALAFGFYWLRKAKREYGWGPEIVFAGFMFFWAVGWGCVNGIGLSRQVNAYLTLTDSYKTNECAVVEGEVRVIHEYKRAQFRETIQIANQQFQYGYGNSVGYSQTIGEGGVLKEGVYARLTYCKNPYPYGMDDIIVRVELKK